MDSLTQEDIKFIADLGVLFYLMFMCGLGLIVGSFR